MSRWHVAFVGGLALTGTAPASGQALDATPPTMQVEHLRTFGEAQGAAPPTSTGVAPFVVPFVQYGAPQRLSGGLSALFPIGKTDRGDGALLFRGFELQGSGGQGGWRVAAGALRAGLPWMWTDVLLTATRTTASPRGAFPESTYIGAEAGIAYIVPVELDGHSAIMFKPSIGFAHRLDGAEGIKRTMFTWSVGAHLVRLRRTF